MIPRRVYPQAHFDVTAKSGIGLDQRCGEVRGLRFTRGPSVLRFLRARFEVV